MIESINGSKSTIINIANQCLEQADKNTDWLPMSIAGMAVLFTAWQAQIARKHSKVSVMPHLHIEIGLLNSELEDGIHLSIANNGQGPAIIKSFHISRGDKVVDLRGDSDEVDVNMRSLLNLNLLYRYQFTTFKGGGVIGPSIQVPLIVIKGFAKDPNNPDKTLQEISNNLSALDINVEYEDAFRESFIFSSQLDFPIKKREGIIKKLWLKFLDALPFK
ncbi:hypothetical protein [Chitinimonas taiwanensis]|uniref:hypothetical protein n=1 Tax=Chitinimonas taiwanensis TaxID=240412 RepID=UPI0035AE8F1F